MEEIDSFFIRKGDNEELKVWTLKLPFHMRAPAFPKWSLSYYKPLAGSYIIKGGPPQITMFPVHIWLVTYS